MEGVREVTTDRDGAPGSILRVLFVLDDTDDTTRSAVVLGLHRELAATGVQMRTVALGPGRRGGLDRIVPVLAPASRSLSAVTQLRREQRWADVVVCWGSVASLIQRLGGSRGRIPTVTVGNGDASGHSRPGSFARWGSLDGPVEADTERWRALLGAVVANRARGR